MSPRAEPFLDYRRGLSNLAIAGSVALLIWLAWWLWQDAPPPVPKQRQLSDVTVTWRCERNHAYEAPGACGPQPCPVCGANAYMVRRYVCPKHGEFEAKLRHRRSPDGVPVLEAIRFEGQEWTESPKIIPCPKCGGSMRPVAPQIFPPPQTPQGE